MNISVKNSFLFGDFGLKLVKKCCYFGFGVSSVLVRIIQSNKSVIYISCEWIQTHIYIYNIESKLPDKIWKHYKHFVHHPTKLINTELTIIIENLHLKITFFKFKYTSSQLNQWKLKKNYIKDTFLLWKWQKSMQSGRVLCNKR